MKKANRLITVTRQDLSSGYQTVQTAHAVADFAVKHPFKFIIWRLFGKFMICLSVENLKSLTSLADKLKKENVSFVAFYETDIGEITALAIQPSTKANRLTKRLKLANSLVGSIDKSN